MRNAGDFIIAYAAVAMSGFGLGVLATLTVSILVKGVF